MINIKEVPGFTYKDELKENESLADHINLDKLVPMIKCIHYYLRKPEDCPWGRGNWIIDIEMKNGQLLCLRYPKEITSERFASFMISLNSFVKDENT